MDAVTGVMIDAETTEASAHVVEASQEYLEFATIADVRRGVDAVDSGLRSGAGASESQYFVVNNRRVEWQSHRPESVQYPLSGN